MADILEIPQHNAAGIKKRTKRITGAKDLTAEDYREMLEEDKRRKENLAEQKQKRMEKRKRKKLEKDKKKEVTKCKGKKVKGKGKQKQVQQCPIEISSESDEEPPSELEHLVPVLLQVFLVDLDVHLVQ